MMLAFSFLSTRVPKSHKCRCRSIPRETRIFRTLWAGTYMCSNFRVYGYYCLETSVCWVYFFLMLYHIIKSTAKSTFLAKTLFSAVLVTLLLYFCRPKGVKKISGSPPLLSPHRMAGLHLVKGFILQSLKFSFHEKEWVLLAYV